MFVSHPMLYPDKVEEREYQVSIAKSCLARPTLVVLHTALGKTIIAVLVIAEILRTKNGKILFLAPTKPLVEQHAASIREFVNTVEDVAVFTGEVAPSKRPDVWEGARIVVSTPQIIHNDIIGGKLTLDGIDLLIFDEAHRAVGDYAYAFVAENFRGKGLIMGMTASPGSDPDKVLEVCRNLGIEGVEIRTDYDPDVAPYIHDIKEEWVKVTMPPEAQRMSQALRSMFKEYSEKLRKYDVLQRGKPATVTDILAANRLVQARIHTEGRENKGLYQALSTIAALLKLNRAIELAETEGYGALQNFLEKLHGDRSKAAQMLLEDARLRDVERVAAGITFEHPKVQRVMAIVEEELRDRPDSRIIVFTQYREISDLVNDELSKVAGARPVRFVGQATKGADKGMRQKEQAALLERFRSGEANVLVATSVAEEGLDIPATDLVIFYEPVASEIRTIQRRGRTGRKHEGRVVYLITKGTKDEGAHWVSRRKERQMHGDMERLRDELKKHIAMGHEPGDAFKSAFKAMVDGGRSKSSRPSKASSPSTGSAKSDPGILPASDGQPSHDVIQDAEQKGQTSLSSFEAGSAPDVIVDSRELNSSVARELSRLGLRLKVETLEVGDYIVSERVAVERKEVSDFLSSMLDGRLFQQVAAMKRAYQRPVIIIEGEGLFTLRNITEQAIYGALASIATDFGVPILFSKDAAETAKYIQALRKREEDGGVRLPLRTGKGRTMLHEQQQFVVEGLPGVSATLAQRLLAHFGSVRAIMNASVEQLCEVKGVGKITAENIKRVIEEKYLQKGE